MLLSVRIIKSIIKWVKLSCAGNTYKWCYIYIYINFQNTPIFLDDIIIKNIYMTFMKERMTILKATI